MTRILLISALLCSSLIANAQFKKNDILLGGQLSYSFSSGTYTQPNYNSPINDSKQNSGNIAISIGKALNENTLIGISLSYAPTSYTNYPNYDGTIPLKYVSDSYGVGIFYQKYKNLGKEFYFFGGASVGYYWSNQSGKDSIGEKLISGSTWSVGLNLSPGISYKISKHFFMDLTLPNLFYASYFKYNIQNQFGAPAQFQTSKNEQFSIGTNLTSNPITSLAIGFRFIL
jgi:hypothetical protein